ncbi:MAG: peptidoglycan DD-metalloendopeptidase family protein [Actinomycetia bacterium]|nr:peptidoglycan DD-metalloendopeptidase family protein [Actinomycetes bacterium]
MKNLITYRALLPLLLLGLLAVAPIPASAQTSGDVSRAKEAEEQAYLELLAADAKLIEGLEELERIQGKIYNLNWRMDRLEEALTEYGDNVDSLNERARLLVFEAYTAGGRNLVTTAFSANNIQDLITSQALFDEASTRNSSQLDQLAAVNRQMDRLTEELTEKEAEVQVLKVQQDAVNAQLVDDREHADELHARAQKNYSAAFARYEAEKRRLAAVAAAKAAARTGGAAGVPAATNGVNCPIAGSNYFIDTWGYPRSGGRTHKGTDMIAARGTKLVAMRSGTVRLNSHPLGGRQVYVFGDDGITYYYAHLSSYPSGLSTGSRVGQGDVVGFVGSSGNATTNVLHLGMIVGGRYVNPYPTVRRAC